ncbi:MAG: hypothetical protein IPJ47_23100 [Anaerolineales bacterium]|nr:hypothetical protein [Anaerolineales bacterium]
MKTGIDITEYTGYKWTKKRQCRNNNNGNQNKNQHMAQVMRFSAPSEYC